MGIISEAKCPRCDRRFSGLRARCPYCGARRGSKGKHSNDNDNPKGKLIIGVLLLVVLIAAVVVLLITSAQEIDRDPDASHSPGVTGSPSLPDDEHGNTEVPGVSTDPIPDTTEPVETETPPPVATISSIILRYNGAEVKFRDASDAQKYEITMKPAESLKLTVKVTPEDTGLEPLWASDNEDVFMVLQTGEVTAIGKGRGTLKVTVGDQFIECTIRVS